MAKRTQHPAQLAFDFNAPIAVVVELRPSATVTGMPVDFSWDEPIHSYAVTTSDNRVVGHVLAHQVKALSRMLDSVDVSIDARLGEIDDQSFEVIVLRTRDDGTFRNVVRCVRPDFEYRLAA